MAGFHQEAVFVEQLVVVGGEIFARALVTARFLNRSGGTVSLAELKELAGVDLRNIPLEAWVRAGIRGRFSRLRGPPLPRCGHQSR